MLKYILNPPRCPGIHKLLAKNKNLSLTKPRLDKNEHIIKDNQVSQQGWDVKDNSKANLSAIQKERK